MNRMYRVVWNRARQALVVVSERAGSGGGAEATGEGACVSPGRREGTVGAILFKGLTDGHGFSLRKTAVVTIAAVAFGMAWAPDAYAVCTTAGVTVTCSGIANPLSPFFSTGANDLTVNADSTSTIGVLMGVGGTALSLTGNNVSLNNAGTIDPNLLRRAGDPPLSTLSSGTVIGNASGPSTVNVNNSGLMAGTSDPPSATLSDLTGMALAVQNPTGGTTSITNSGTISSTATTPGTIGTGDMAVVAVYGGSQVSFTNTANGTIDGRVAFQVPGTAGLGNTFTNAGTITGSVSLGAGGTNTFNALTGSSVDAGTGVTGNIMGVVGVSIGFAAAGIVDGGAGGNNTLHLQQASGGPAGGSISSPNYFNFQHLAVDSGSWTISGASSEADTTLSSGSTAIINDATGLGSGLITSNGGALQASAVGLNLTNTVSLGSGGLTVAGFNGLTLSGTMTGGGSLTMAGAGTLTLRGFNTYTGGTNLNNGSLLLGNAGAIGSGSLNVGAGAVGFDTSTSMTLGNAINIGSGANLSLLGSNALTLSGMITGQGGIVKSGAGTVTIGVADTYTGGTTISAGTIALSANGGLSNIGAVALSSAGATLDISGASANQTIGAFSGASGSTLALGGRTLTFGVASNQTFAGTISGTGGLVKQGLGIEVLSGANTYGGGTELSAGGLVLGNSGAIGTGALNVSGDSTLDATTAVTLSNAVSLNAFLTVSGSNNVTLNGVVSGASVLTKNGTASLTLGAANSLTGPIVVNGGTLALSGAGNLNASANVDLVNATTTFDVSGATTAPTIGALLGAAGSKVTLGANTLTLGTTTDNEFDGTITGTGGLIKQGSGAETLTGANTYTGGTTINAGRLTLSTGGSLAANGAVTLAGAGTTFGIAVGTSQTIGALSGVFGSSIKLGVNTLTFGDATDQTLDSVVSGSGGLVKQGAGVQTLAGANTYSGGTTLNAGGLIVGSNTALGSNTGALTVGGAATLDSSTAVALGNNIVLNANLTVLGSNSLTLNGAISGTGGLMKDGLATLTLNGISTYTGGTQINAGTLALGANAGLSSAGTVDVATGATFDLSAGNGTQQFGTLTGGGAIILGANTLTLGGPTDGTFSGAIGGSGGLVKVGTGTETMTGANTYTGGTQITAGTLALGAGGSLAATGAVILGGSGTGFDISTSAANQTIGALSGAGGDVTLGASTLTFGDASDQTFGGTISGTGGVIKDGAGKETLTGANTYIGGTTIMNGTLALAGIGSLDAGGAVVLDGPTAVFDIGNGVGNQTIGALSGTAGQIVLGANYLSFGGAVDQTFGGIISGSGGIVKHGSGTETLTGVNTFTGEADVTEGTLALAGAGTLSSSADVDLANAGTALDVSGATGEPTIGSLSGVGGTSVTLGGNTLLLGSAMNGTFAGTISGAGGLVKNGSGTQTLIGVNSYTGGTTINAGTLALVGNGSLAASGAVNVAGAGAAFDISGATGSQTVGALSGVAGSTIALGGNSLTFGDGTDRTLASDITGTGGIIKEGSGRQTLNGNSTYSGGTTLNAGGLVVGSNTALGTGTLTVGGAATLDSSAATMLDNNVVMNANLTMLGSNDLTLNGSLSGTGGLTKDGIATLTLNGTNTYTGGTLVKAGTLALGANASLASTGLVDVEEGATFDLSAGNGTQVFGTLTGRGAVNLGSNDLAIGGATDETFDGAIAGTGSVTKQGAGTETMTGANTYTGGTFINAGTLALVAGGSLAATGRVTLAGTGSFDISGASASQTIGALSGSTGSTVVLGSNSLTFGDATNQGYDGTISGAGGVTKAGSGAATFTGAQAYTGATTIAAGTLALSGAGSIASSSGLTNNGTFDISATATGATLANLSGTGNVNLGAKSLTLANANGIYAGSFTGSGTLIKQGAGSLILNGNSASFAGNTEVAAGMLEVGDMDTPAAVLGGDVAVEPGATLRGHGTIAGNVVNNGIVAPGGSIGTLTVGGNYTQTANGTLAIEVSPTQASQLKVGGSAALAGTLAVTYDPGTYTGKTYTLVSAANGVSGTFANVTSSGSDNLGGLTPSIGYGANAVDLTLAGASSGGATVVAPTQTSIYTALGTAAIMGAQAHTSALLDRMGGAGTLAGATQGGDPASWATITGTHGKVDGAGGEPGFQTQRYGFLGGLERKTGSNTMGVALGYDHVNINENETGDSGTLDTLRASVYGGRNVGGVNLSATAGVGVDFLSQKRQFDSGTARGDHSGQEFNLGGQASLPMALGGMTLTPRVGMRYAYFHADSFNESGAGGQDLDVGRDSVQSLQPYAGVTLDHAFGSGPDAASLQLRAGYAFELLNANRTIGVSSQDGTEFRAPGTNLPRGYMTAGIGVTLHPARNLDVSAGFDALLHTSRASAQQGNLTVQYHF